MSGIEPVVLASLIAAGTTAATTGVALATRPGLPKLPEPQAPPAPPSDAEAPPLAPTEATIGEGVARRRQRDQRRFGLSQTILAGAPKLGEPFSGASVGVPRLGG